MVSSSRSHLKSGSWFENFKNHVIRSIFAVILIVLGLWIYHDFLSDIIKGRYIVGLLILYLILSYAILPKLYRLLSKIFIPNYFIGRTQVGDGMLGDPINLAFNGGEKQLIDAMEKAGWQQADKLNFKSSVKMSYTAVFKKPYPNAPVSSLFLFNTKQDFAFEKDLGGNPRKRHHIRFWRTPENWWLPGGYRADWLAAATFDEHVGLSLFTGQITHKIDGNVDQERDHVVGTLEAAKVIKTKEVIEHFTTSYHSRNGGGDSIHTDGALPFVTFD